MSEMSKILMPRKRSALTFCKHPLETTIGAAARFLDAHDKEPADDRDVTLPTGAHGRADQLRRSVGPQAIDVEAVKAARHHHIAGKGHVGIGEVQQ